MVGNKNNKIIYKNSINDNRNNRCNNNNYFYNKNNIR